MSNTQQQPTWPNTTLVDTHTHVFLEEFDPDRAEVIRRALDNGVKYMLLPNLNTASLTALHNCCQTFTPHCLPLLGLHPCYVDDSYQQQLQQLEQELQQHPHKYIGIGEIGLDYYWSLTYKKEMYNALRTQLQWAKAYNLPVTLHTREATADVVKCIMEVGPTSLRGVFHSFTGNETELQQVLELPNFMVGINGVVTFKKSHLPSLLPQIPLDRIVVETDAPYLAPTPYRGKRNEPSYIPNIVQFLADQYQIGYNQMAKQLLDNSAKMFNLALYETA